MEREADLRYSGGLCITPKYLPRIIKDITGYTALDYIENYVVTEAKAMLNSTMMTVQQISDSLNFPSQSVFGKYFKRVTGMHTFPSLQVNLPSTLSYISVATGLSGTLCVAPHVVALQTCASASYSPSSVYSQIISTSSTIILLPAAAL